MATFDWNALFQLVLLIGGAFIGWQQRRATAKAKEAADLALIADNRTKIVEAKVQQIAVQTDGLLKHLQAVARKEGVIEGIEAADMASDIAKIDANVAVVRVADKLKDLNESGELTAGAFQDVEAELRSLMTMMEAEHKRIKKPSGLK